MKARTGADIIFGPDPHCYESVSFTEVISALNSEISAQQKHLKSCVISEM